VSKHLKWALVFGALAVINLTRAATGWLPNQSYLWPGTAALIAFGGVSAFLAGARVERWIHDDDE
jgi:hypothetical protein